MLFDEFTRTDTSPAKYSEPSFVALNRSARPSMTRARHVLQTWYAAFPESARADLLSRFRSTERRQHLGAVFELYCHSLLRGQDFAVDSPGEAAPDFVANSGASRFFLEATLVAESDEAVKAAPSNSRCVGQDPVSELLFEYGYPHAASNSICNPTPPRVPRTRVSRTRSRSNCCRKRGFNRRAPKLVLGARWLSSRISSDSQEADRARPRRSETDWDGHWTCRVC